MVIFRGKGVFSEAKAPNRQPAEKRLRFDASLFTVARAAGCGAVHSPADAVRLVCAVASPSSPQTGAEGDVGPDVEVLLLDAVESVLAAYGDLVVSPTADRGAAMASCMMSASLANLRTLALFLSHRPTFSSPVLAALFQLTILAVKHAPLKALDEAGCCVLVSLLDLLGYLPRGSETDGGLGIQHVARITGRNIMRRVCPRLFLSDFSSSFLRQGDAATCGAAVSEQVDRDLIPWVERQLLPLHVVTGEGAQADLKEDRRLALLLLEYLCPDESADSFSSSRRVAIYYLADAVTSLLEEKEECGGIDGSDRQLALAFLSRANRLFSGASAPGVPDAVRVCEAHEGPLRRPPMSVRDVREFLLSKDAAYAAEFTALRRRIGEEREAQDLLRWRRGELARGREEALRELQEGLRDPPGEAAPFAEGRARDVANTLRPLEELTVALHEEQRRESVSV